MNDNDGVKTRKKIFAIVLAAGESRRMGAPKQLLTVCGVSFLRRAIEGFIYAGIDDIFIVCGSHFEIIKTHILDSNYSIVKSEFLKRVYIVENECYKDGQLSSIKAGLKAFSEKKQVDFYKGFMIQLIDRPLVRYNTFKKLKELFEINDSQILLPSYKMRRGHPACFSIELAEKIKAIGADGSLKDILAANPDAIRYLPVDDAGIITNIDTPSEYEKIKGVAYVD